MDAFGQFITQNNIKHVTPSSPLYAKIKDSFINIDSVQPPYIVRPKDAEQVSAIVKCLTSNDINFTVRAGGHDLHGRCHAKDSVTIDLREISYARLDKSSNSVKIGGGTLNGQVISELAKHGLTTPTTSVPSVGYSGWSIYGGYGPFSSCFGLGVDQIIAAKIVNAQGDIVDADSELLKCIRGAGGAFGVIVELTAKVYPLEKLLAGTIVYESEDVEAVMNEFNKQLSVESDIPSPLYLQQVVMTTPVGPRFCILFSWASDNIEEGKTWFDKSISFVPSSISKTLKQDVKVMSIPEWQEETGKSFPTSAYGGSMTFSFRKITPQLIKIVAAHAKTMPSGSEVLCFHELRGESAAPNSQSVFGTREHHFMLEIVLVVPSADKVNSSKEWGARFYDDILVNDSSSILKGSYLSAAGTEKSDFRNIFGQNFDSLVELKKKYDPNNVFKSANAKFTL